MIGRSGAGGDQNASPRPDFRTKHLGKHRALLGAVTALLTALPSFASEDCTEAISEVSHTVAVPGQMMRQDAEHYALEVKGDSMINAGINDGDIVVIRETNTAESGDIIVALVDGHEATLKTLRKRGNAIALEAANPAYETRVYPADMVRVQGKLVGLIRSY